MSLAIVHSRAQKGIDAPLVTVEAHISNGLPSLSIVGLPETAVKESKDRVRGALLNSNFEFPARRITINLAPADLPKEGGRFDLAIALGILAASGQVDKQAVQNCECIGELSLGGELRPVNGALAVALQSGKSARQLILPMQNAAEASLADQCVIIAARHLLDVCAHINCKQQISQFASHNLENAPPDYGDFADVHGQFQVKRSLEIAAAGNHNVLR